jgi:hypothetical protein
MLVAATGVGAGDLLTDSLGGSKVGVSILWAAILGSVLKTFLNEGVARWQLATGITLLKGWARLGAWLRYLFFIYLLGWSFFTEAPAGAAQVRSKQRAARLDPATLLKRSFDFDVFTCPGCGGRRRAVAVLKGPGVKEVLRHLGLPTLPLPLASVRGPPQREWLH